jgi:hypothetical protein
MTSLTSNRSGAAGQKKTSKICYFKKTSWPWLLTSHFSALLAQFFRNLVTQHKKNENLEKKRK